MKPRLITYKGVTKTSPEWAREYGIDPEILNNRIRHGWNMDMALHTPVRRQISPKYEYQGKMLTAQEISVLHGNLAPSSVRQRLDKGMTVEEVHVP